MSQELNHEHLGMSAEELNQFIEQRMRELDDAQDDAENLGAFGDLLRSATQIAFYRAAELITANNERITAQMNAQVLRIEGFEPK